MKKNPGVSYNGKVGAKMRPLKGRAPRNGALKRMFICVGGPMAGHKLALQEDGATLPICMKGQFGHYSRLVGSLLYWHPAIGNQELAA